MIQVASLATRVLGDATELVQGFVLDQLNEQGGFNDRCGDSDLYYTVFGLEAMRALKVEIPVDKVRPYLESFGNGSSLDLIHLTSLIRCWADINVDFSHLHKDFTQELERFRSPDGGYNTEIGLEEGTGYAAFLVYGALQDMDAKDIDTKLITDSIQNLKVGNGSYGMFAGQTEGTTPTTAAACVALHDMGVRDFDLSKKWMINNFCVKGGFFAIPDAPMPDLLSTATALHTLSVLGADVSELKEGCLDFVDSLWTSKGAFYGTWADDILDVEYCLYGLLALGHLSTM
jgi:prenyltransferase beta subunit